MKTLLLSLTILLSVFYTCSNPTQPPIKPPPPPVEPDSTTQNFTFQTYEFGDGYSSSNLNDVWIFNENNIWAVGYISPDDSSNNRYHVGNPNIIKWNGEGWKVQPFSGTSSGMYGIWAADSNHIYFADGGVVKYDYVTGFKSEDFSKLGFVNFQGVHKLWGSSTNNIWGVGPWGTIVHYDGSPSGAGWTKIDFDQQWRFNAITGSNETGVAYASANDENFNRILVKLENNTTEIIFSTQQGMSPRTFDLKYMNDYLYMAGSDFSSTLIWRYSINAKEIDSLFTLVPTTGLFNITGEKEIDLYYWGSDFGVGKMVHYNGKRYKIFDLPKASLTTGGADTEGDVSAFVGNNNNKGFITVVNRIKQ